MPCRVLGTVGGSQFTVKYNGAAVIDLPVAAMSEAWRNAIPRRMQVSDSAQVPDRVQENVQAAAMSGQRVVQSLPWPLRVVFGE